MQVPNLYSDTRIPDDVWPVYIERTRALAAGLGANKQQQTGEGPGTDVGRGVDFYNPDNGTKIGSAATV